MEARRGMKQLGASVAEEVREQYATGEYTMADLGTQYGVSRQSIWSIVRGKSYKSGAVVKRTYKRPAVSKCYKLSEEKADEIRMLYDSGMSRRELAAMYDVSISTIDRVKNFVTWDLDIED